MDIEKIKRLEKEKVAHIDLRKTLILEKKILDNKIKLKSDIIKKLDLEILSETQIKLF